MVAFGMDTTVITEDECLARIPSSGYKRSKGTANAMLERSKLFGRRAGEYW
jgi:hypothetical protein